MLSLSFTAAMLGIEGYGVRVEADSAPGSPALTIIGRLASCPLLRPLDYALRSG